VSSKANIDIINYTDNLELYIAAELCSQGGF
jgi:hypothetical protein